MCTTSESPAEIKGDIAVCQRICTDRLVLRELALPWKGEARQGFEDWLAW